jgi:flagellar biosynthesis/type III secretory pathway chaperone
MLKPVIELEQILGDELTRYEELYSLEEEKSERIIQRDGAAMEKISERQEGLLEEVARLEERRLSMIQEYARLNNLRDIGRELSLRDVILSMDEDSSAHLSRMGIELKRLLVKLDRLRKSNERLIQDNLEFFEILVSGLRNETGLSGGYGRDGREEEKVSSSLVINQTA